MKSLDQEFTKANLYVGRDNLFKVLRKPKMLTLRKKFSARTTNSYHCFYKYSNIIKDREITRPNQVWASDITYLKTVKRFCYLAIFQGKTLQNNLTFFLHFFHTSLSLF
jgi:putative transposase